MQTEVNILFQRDLDKLKNELELFKKEENIWKTTGDISNAAGNLCLHLMGNLNHFVGAHIGTTGYQRDRHHEFSSKDIPRKKLVQQIESTKVMLDEVVDNLHQERLEEVYPLQPFGYEMTNRYFLLHLFGHLNYHLGQVNYLRRVLEG